MSLDGRLAEIEAQVAQTQERLMDPAVASDPDALRRYGKELARLEPVVDVVRRLRAAREELAGAREMRDDEVEPELRDMARAEVERLESLEATLEEELRLLLLPHDPNDERSVIMEIRAGTGGEEAALFAAELYRMYARHAERHRWQVEVLSSNETGIGGLREIIFEVRAEGAYSRLKFEGGVHRVQRVPETESSGRIHTSTATV
ncbi:MAG: PCRF domain-containing protein, partial [Candidatus Limnocylindrales bacterium]